jgi:hypothetical protein
MSMLQNVCFCDSWIGGGNLESISNWVEFNAHENELLGYWALGPVENKTYTL